MQEPGATASFEARYDALKVPPTAAARGELATSTPDGRPSEATPDKWFAAADAVGRGAELEAVVVRRALAYLPVLPPN